MRQSIHGCHCELLFSSQIPGTISQTQRVHFCGQVPGATGDYRTEFHAKAAAVADTLTDGRHEFVFLHVKAVDDTGHDRHPAQKVSDCVPG